MVQKLFYYSHAKGGGGDGEQRRQHRRRRRSCQFKRGGGGGAIQWRVSNWTCDRIRPFHSAARRRPWGNIFASVICKLAPLSVSKLTLISPPPLSSPLCVACLPFGPKWGHLKKPECKYRFDSYDQEERTEGVSERRGVERVCFFTSLRWRRRGESPDRPITDTSSDGVRARE